MNPSAASIAAADGSSQLLMVGIKVSLCEVLGEGLVLTESSPAVHDVAMQTEAVITASSRLKLIIKLV